MPPSRSIAVVLNAAAGTAIGKADVATELVDLFRAAGEHEVEIVRLREGEPPGDAARRVSGHASIVVAAGGDGTVGGVAAGVVDSPAALGVLPLGTLNHFARDLHIPFDLGAAVAIVCPAAPRRWTSPR